MKKLLFLMAFALISQNLFAIDKVKQEENNQSILFELSGLDNLGADSFSGGLGYKWFFSDKWSLRSSIGYLTNNKNNQFQLNGEIINLLEKRSSFVFNPSIIYNFSNNNTIAGYIGLGCFGKTNKSVGDTIIGSQLEKFETNKLEYGGNIILGAEWFVVENLSLSMEYNLKYTLFSGNKIEGVNSNIETELPNGRILEMGNSSYKFVLSFYIN